MGLRRFVRQFGSFGLIGIGGFVVDTAALYAVMQALDMGLYSGRLVSWLAAATFTWYLNRRYTFVSDPGVAAHAQWVRFLSANALGGLINYGTYALLVASMPFVARWPPIGVAAGSIAGLTVNFALSRRYVFSR